MNRTVPFALLERSRSLSDPRVPALAIAQQVCSHCHGMAGAAESPDFPVLAGQHADHLVKRLELFQRTDERPEGSVMKTVAHGLAPQDIAGVAAWLQEAAAR